LRGSKTAGTMLVKRNLFLLWKLLGVVLSLPSRLPRNENTFFWW